MAGEGVLVPSEPAELAARAAGAIAAAFDAYQDEFQAITRRARQRFERRQWREAQADAALRLNVYKKVIDATVAEVGARLGEQRRDEAVWAQMKAEYARLSAARGDLELAETWFNSVTRRVFTTVGVNPAIEFIASDFRPPQPDPSSPTFCTYPCESGAEACLERLLADYPFDCGWADQAGDARRAAQRMQAELRRRLGSPNFERVELLCPVFYRGNGAYLVGRVVTQSGIVPLALCLAHPPGGVRMDAVLLDEDDVSIVFSFTRSYFHVETQRPYEMVAFLKTIMPLKRIAELYISIGYNKHGKTELYRDMIGHLASSRERFEIAPGERGMVMAVFTMPSYDIVFKVIRDKIEPPKSATRQEVMKRYDLVFQHDRAGRLVDAQEFEHLRFERERFDEACLAELLASAPGVVSLDGDCVVIRHVYTERRMTPLNLYIRQAGEAEAAAAVGDYGRAIKDLAATNIFPGDVLLKNFGVTRHGRVVFYDYDELTLLTECVFRKLPQASTMDEEMSAEPWFYVGPNDIFPEEFLPFLGLPGPLREVFLAQHADLFGVTFWREMQRHHRAGEVVDILPYGEEARLV